MPNPSDDSVVPTTVAATSVTGPVEAPTPPDPAPAHLVLWAVPDFAGEADGGDGPVRLRDHLVEIGAARPELRTTVVLAPAVGRGNVDALLGSTASVAPGALPDLVMLPLSSLPAMIASDLLEPLPSGGVAERATGAFEFARSAVVDDAGSAYGVPFAVDTLHAIARDEPPPETWSDAADEDRPLLVPFGQVSRGALAFAVSVFVSENGAQAPLDAPELPDVVKALAPVAALVDENRLRGVDTDEDVRAVWNAFLLDEAPAAIVRAGVFAPQQSSFPALTWGAMPGRDREAPAVGWGWAFVITARDGDRATRAAALVEELTTLERRDWIVEAEHVPAWPDGWPAVFEGVVDAPPSREYMTFASDLLGSAVGVSEAVGRASNWSDGLTRLLSGEGVDAAAESIAADA
jgi:hypothetical protein